MQTPATSELDMSRFRPWRIALERADVAARTDAVRALALYQEAIEKAQHEKPGTRALPICLVRLEQFYQDQQRWSEAQGIMQRLVILYEALHGPHSLPVGVALMKEADLCDKQAHIAEATKLRERARAILDLPLTRPRNRPPALPVEQSPQQV